MKSTAILGLIIASAACFLLVSASAAMAETTTLCQSEQVPCPEEEKYPEGTQVEAAAEGLTLSNEYETVTCKESIILGEVSSESLANPLELILTSVSLSGCTCGEIHHLQAKVTVLNLGEFLLSRTAKGLGAASFSGTKVLVSCFFNCTYLYGENPIFHFLSTVGEEPASLTAEKLGLTKEPSAFCPPGTVITATYKVASPTPLYISS